MPTVASRLRTRTTAARSAPASQPDPLLLDRSALDNDRLREDLAPLDLLFSRATADHVRELLVARRTVVKDGAVTGVDLPFARGEAVAQMRAGMRDNAVLAAALTVRERAVAQEFEPGCC